MQQVRMVLNQDYANDVIMCILKINFNLYLIARFQIETLSDLSVHR